MELSWKAVVPLAWEQSRIYEIPIAWRSPRNLHSRRYPKIPKNKEFNFMGKTLAANEVSEPGLIHLSPFRAQ